MRPSSWRGWQDQGFPVSVTTEGITYSGTRKSGEDKQRAFTEWELKRLFGGPELATYLGTPSLAHQAWLPTIALFTGARVNEICQLNPQCDISLDERSGIWFFSFTEETDTDARVTKSIKNAVSMRRVPIHSRLLAPGLLDYVAAQKAARHKLLFPEWKPSRGRASPAAEKWFGQVFAGTGVARRDARRANCRDPCFSAHDCESCVQRTATP